MKFHYFLSCCDSDCVDAVFTPFCRWALHPEGEMADAATYARKLQMFFDFFPQQVIVVTGQENGGKSIFTKFFLFFFPFLVQHLVMDVLCVEVKKEKCLHQWQQIWQAQHIWGNGSSQTQQNHAWSVYSGRVKDRINSKRRAWWIQTIQPSLRVAMEIWFHRILFQL